RVQRVAHRARLGQVAHVGDALPLQGERLAQPAGEPGDVVQVAAALLERGALSVVVGQRLQQRSQRHAQLLAARVADADAPLVSLALTRCAHARSYPALWACSMTRRRSRITW